MPAWAKEKGCRRRMEDAGGETPKGEKDEDI
jgi:hypothetical protein